MTQNHKTGCIKFIYKRSPTASAKRIELFAKQRFVAVVDVDGMHETVNQNSAFKFPKNNIKTTDKCSGVAEMGDRLATIETWAENFGCAPSAGGLIF